MSNSVNKVYLLGNVNPEPKLRQTKSGTPVMNFNMATTEHWTTEEGKRKELTEWHKVVVWGRQAEILERMVQKGTLVHVEGSLTNREWIDPEGHKRISTEVRAHRVQALARRRPQD